jgi:hypothetical protein
MAVVPQQLLDVSAGLLPAHEAEANHCIAPLPLIGASKDEEKKVLEVDADGGDFVSTASTEDFEHEPFNTFKEKVAALCQTFTAASNRN